MDAERIAESFRFDAGQVAELRARWLALLDLSVWGELKSAKIGAVPRLRKRALELGEKLRSLVGDRGWIPQPREQVKGAMAASLNLRDALLQLERAAVLLEGGADFPRFEADLLVFRQRLLRLMEHHERLWGDLLESQYGAEDD
jgi:hypothetical protein